MTPSYVQHHTQRKLIENYFTNSLIINFNTSEVFIPDCAWTVQFLGKNDGDFILEDDERIALNVWITDYEYHPSAGNYYLLGQDDDDPFLDNVSDLLQPHEMFSLEITSAAGAV